MRYKHMHVHLATGTAPSDWDRVCDDASRNGYELVSMCSHNGGILYLFRKPIDEQPAPEAVSTATLRIDGPNGVRHIINL